MTASREIIRRSEKDPARCERRGHGTERVGSDAGAAYTKGEEMIYFVQAGDGGPIKIGYVEGEARGNVLSRMALLQVGNHETLSLLATAPGGLEVEQGIQKQFAEGRLRGEWFRADTPGLAETIQWVREQENVTAWQLRDDGLQLCEWCGTGVVESPRRSLCSAECASASRAAAQRARKAAA